MTRVGEMDKLVTFQTGGLTSDGLGLGGTTAWTTAVTVWAAIWPLKGQEVIENLKLEHTVTHKIRCWYTASINAKQRIKYGTRYFQIISLINPDEANVELEILAEEIVE